LEIPGGGVSEDKRKGKKNGKRYKRRGGQHAEQRNGRISRARRGRGLGRKLAKGEKSRENGTGGGHEENLKTVRSKGRPG